MLGIKGESAQQRGTAQPVSKDSFKSLHRSILRANSIEPESLPEMTALASHTFTS